MTDAIQTVRQTPHPLCAMTANRWMAMWRMWDAAR